MTDRIYTFGGRVPDWNLIPAHMREGVKLWIEKGVLPGDFLAAFLRNDLKETFVRADDINRQRIGDFVTFFYMYAPINCWGSPENMTEWMKRGGYDGGE